MRMPSPKSEARLRVTPLFEVTQRPTFIPDLRHAAVSAHAATFRLCENRRGLQSSVQLLHHPAHARLASQPATGRHCGRSQGADRAMA